jgi:hypothetical protein
MKRCLEPNKGETTMLQVLEMTSDNLLATRISGQVTADEYDRFLSLIAEMAQKYDSLRWYCELEDFDGVSFQALVDDVRFDFEHRGEFRLERAAVVGDTSLQKWATSICDVLGRFWPIPTDESRYFDQTDREDALRWVRE